MSQSKIELFQKQIGYTFEQPMNLKKALTHTSFAYEKRNNKKFNNERLEFLGDAVLEVVVSEFLFHNYDLAEGELTKLRANIVCEPTLAFIAKNINLGEYIFLGKGEENSGGRERNSILSDALEAVIGSIFIDGGFEAAKVFITEIILIKIDEIGVKNIFSDYKTKLQEIVQAYSTVGLQYDIVKEEGPDHNKCFTAEVSHVGKVIGRGVGKNKKEAEQNAAQDALKNSDIGVMG